MPGIGIFKAIMILIKRYYRIIKTLFQKNNEKYKNLIKCSIIYSYNHTIPNLNEKFPFKIIYNTTISDF